MSESYDPTPIDDRRRVLFVDDEKGVRDGLRRVLRPHRAVWDMHFAGGVDEALETLKGGDFDAIVSDVNMPVRDGFDLLTAVREDPELASIPVVILTGNGESGIKSRALDLGATDLLNKPVDPDDLVARLRSVLRLKHAQDELRDQNERLEEAVQARTAALEFSRVELVWRLGKAGEFRDSDTGFHVVRVGYYARELAEGLGLDAEACNKLFVTAPLHDIGKIGIPDAILLKPGKLSDDEWVVMRQHTTIGAEILREEFVGRRQIAELGMRMIEGVNLFSNNPFTEMAAEIAEGHHERWDGKGYPFGLEGDSISLAARITTVADVYDALSSVRPYKRAFEESEVLDIIRRGSGAEFDPEVVSVFEKSLSRFRSIREEFQDEDGSSVQADVQSTLDSLNRAV